MSCKFIILICNWRMYRMSREVAKFFERFFWYKRSYNLCLKSFTHLPSVEENQNKSHKLKMVSIFNSNYNSKQVDHSEFCEELLSAQIFGSYYSKFNVVYFYDKTLLRSKIMQTHTSRSFRFKNNSNSICYYVFYLEILRIFRSCFDRRYKRWCFTLAPILATRSARPGSSCISPIESIHSTSCPTSIKPTLATSWTSCRLIQRPNRLWVSTPLSWS